MIEQKPQPSPARELSLRIGNKLEVNNLRKETAVKRDDPYEHWLALTQAKKTLAQALGWENYAPTAKITDPKITAFIRTRNQAIKNGTELHAPDEASQALGEFLEARTAYRRSRRRVDRYNHEADRLTRFSTYLQTNWTKPDPEIDNALAKDAERKRPDRLTEDVLQHVLFQRATAHSESIQQVTEEPTAKAPEAKTRGFLDRLKEPVAKIKNSPTTARRVLAAAALTGALAAAIFIGNGSLKEINKFIHPAHSEKNTASAPSLASSCPNYDLIRRYDWDIKTACQVTSTPHKQTGYGRYFGLTEEQIKALDPDYDPLHWRTIINNDPAVETALAKRIQEKFGWEAYGIKRYPPADPKS